MKLFLLLAVFAWLIVKYWGFLVFFSVCIIIFYLSGFWHLINVKAARNRIYERILKYNDRVQELMRKYNDREIVERILDQSIWIGQTAEQLRDSLGEPVDIGEWRSGEESGEKWKYLQTGKNRYALKIDLTYNPEEKDLLVNGWNKK